MRDYKTIKFKNVLKSGFFQHYHYGSTNKHSNKQNVVMDEMQYCIKEKIDWSRENIEEGYDEAVEELAKDKLITYENGQYHLTKKGKLYSAISRHDFKEASCLWKWRSLWKFLLWNNKSTPF